jgi:hypothetical protein
VGRDGLRYLRESTDFRGVSEMRRLLVGVPLALALFTLGSASASACGWSCCGCNTYGYYAAPAYGYYAPPVYSYYRAPVYTYYAAPVYSYYAPRVYSYYAPPAVYGYYRSYGPAYGGYYGYAGWRRW